MEAQTPWRPQRPALGLAVCVACDTGPQQLLLGLLVGASASCLAQTLVGGAWVSGAGPCSRLCAHGREESIAIGPHPVDVILSTSIHGSIFGVAGHPTLGQGTLGAEGHSVAHLMVLKSAWQGARAAGSGRVSLTQMEEKGGREASRSGCCSVGSITQRSERTHPGTGGVSAVASMDGWQNRD